jgi:hypothetical protein
MDKAARLRYNIKMRRSSLSAKLVTCVAALGSLAGCAHTLYITGRSSGAVAQSTVTTTPGQHGGELAIELKGKAYKGRWLYMTGAGSVSLATMTATNGLHSSAATETAFELPTQGNGSIILAAADESTLRCVFDYSEWSKSGIGVCQDSAGEIYDIQVD